MEKILKYKKYILIGILVVLCILFAFIGKNLEIQGGGACLCLGLTSLVVAWEVWERQIVELKNFDAEASEILEDIQLNQEESEYYDYYNVDILKKRRKKMVKKQKKQLVSCCILGVVLIVVSIICFV